METRENWTSFIAWTITLVWLSHMKLPSLFFHPKGRNDDVARTIQFFFSAVALVLIVRFAWSSKNYYYNIWIGSHSVHCIVREHYRISCDLASDEMCFVSNSVEVSYSTRHPWINAGRKKTQISKYIHSNRMCVFMLSRWISDMGIWLLFQPRINMMIHCRNYK